MIVKNMIIGLAFWGSVLLGSCCFAMERVEKSAAEKAADVDAFKTVLASAAKTMGTPGTIKVVLTINFGWLNNKNCEAYFDSKSPIGNAAKSLKGSAKLLVDATVQEVKLKEGSWYWKSSESIQDTDNRSLDSFVAVGGVLALKAKGKWN